MKRIKQLKLKAVPMLVAGVCVLTGCGRQPQNNILQSISGAQGGTSQVTQAETSQGAQSGAPQVTQAGNSQGTQAGIPQGTQAGNSQGIQSGTSQDTQAGSLQGTGDTQDGTPQGIGGNSQDGTTIPTGQISDQSFVVELDGWGEVTFAPFEPEYETKINEDGDLIYGEVRFMLLKDGQAVYRFPGFDEDDIRWYVQCFQQVTAVAFRDYNEDGRKDVLVITESVYTGDDPTPSREARLYTQEEGSKEFILDEPVMEYLLESRPDNMEEVYKALETYSQNYSVCTSKTAWEVERFAQKVKNQILNGDFEGLSQEIAYPVTVDGITYQDKESFLKADFVGNLNPAVTSELEGETCRRMFANWSGIMLGNGCVWIAEVLDDNHQSQGLKVTGLNGLTSAQP